MAANPTFNKPNQLTSLAWLIEWVVFLRPPQHKIGYFGYVSRKPIFWLGMEKTKPNTTKARIQQSKEIYYNTK